MDFSFEEETVDVLNAVSSEKRLSTLAGLAQGRTRTEIADEYGMTSPALQPYINDFKENGLVEVHGKDYEVTELGEKLLQQIDELDDIVKFTSLLEKINSMFDAGLDYEQVYDSLTDQGYDQDQILEAIATAADEDLDEVDFQFH